VAALEPALVSRPGMRIEELQLAGVVGINEHRQHLAPEQVRQHVDMHDEVGARARPIPTWMKPDAIARGGEPGRQRA
jgi:hypothetical protein